MEQPRLLDQVRNALRVRHYSLRTQESYIQWIKRYTFFHNKKHPDEMGEPVLNRGACGVCSPFDRIN